MRYICPLLLLVSAVPVHAQDSATDDGEWIALFNGKDLSGWTVKIRGHEAGDNFGNTFRVEDGLLKVRYDGYASFDEKFGHIFYNKPYSHYRLRVEYRFVGEQCKNGPGWAIRNSGLMLHGEPVETMAVDQNFPTSIEVQLLGGVKPDMPRTTANLCTPGTNVEMNGTVEKRHCRSSTSETYHGEQWVTVEVEVRGNESIKHFVNGELVLEYQKPQLDERGNQVTGGAERIAMLKEKNGGLMLSGGTISLQSESGPVDFRKVELRVLAP